MLLLDLNANNVVSGKLIIVTLFVLHPGQCQEVDYPPAFYQFGYQVNSQGDYHGHMEHVEGGTTRGEFKVRLPDGRLQITSYEADDNGFRPRISYEIDPSFQPPSGVIGQSGGHVPYRPPPRQEYVTPLKSYETPHQAYRPPPDEHYTIPNINYKPRQKAHHHKVPEAGYTPPKKAQYRPETHYTVPKTSYESPAGLVYKPRGHYLPPKEVYQPPEHNYVTPQPSYHHGSTNERHDIPEDYSSIVDNLEYFLVPLTDSKGSRPVLALLARKKN